MKNSVSISFVCPECGELVNNMYTIPTKHKSIYRCICTNCYAEFLVTFSISIGIKEEVST